MWFLSGVNFFMHFSVVFTTHLKFVAPIVAKPLGNNVEIGLLFKQTSYNLSNPGKAFRLIETKLLDSRQSSRRLYKLLNNPFSNLAIWLSFR